MVYVDLNPVRAGLTQALSADDHTSAGRRLAAVQKTPEGLPAPLAPVAGTLTAPRLPINTASYLQLLDWTGRQVHPGKQGKIASSAPSVLRKLGVNADRWALEVKGIGSGYWRAVGSANDLLVLATALGQRWMKGLGFAKALART